MKAGIRSTTIPFVIGIIVLVTGIAVIFGWIFDILLLKNVIPGLATMKVTTASGFILIGIALIIDNLRIEKYFWFVQLCAAFVTVIGLVSLAEYVFQWDAGIDEFFVKDQLTAAGGFPGRPSHMTAFNFFILGGAYLISATRSGRRVAEILSVIGMAVALVAIVGFTLDVNVLYGATFYSSMALHTSVLFFLVSFAIWWRTPDNLLQELLCAPNSTGILVRRMIPFAVIVPIALSVIWLFGARAGLYKYEFGWALFVATTIFALIGFIVVSIRPMIKLEKEKNNNLLAIESYAKKLRTANALLETLSNTDPLTDVGNRRAFDACLAHELETRKRYDISLSLMIVDLNNFKTYNDELGHDAGDNALVNIASILKDHARKTDFVARIGGDEFAIILAETDLAGASMQAERLQKRIKSFNWPIRPVSVSIGIAEASSEASDKRSLFRAADKALYCDKEVKHRTGE